MPHYVRCVEEDTWLTESRSIATWRALQLLAQQLLPSNAMVKLPEKRKVYSKEEVKAWTEFFFKVRDYKPSTQLNLSAYYVGPGAVDYQRLAADLGVRPEEAAAVVKSLDKPLMMAAAEEMLQAVMHSSKFSHTVELVKGRV